MGKILIYALSQNVGGIEEYTLNLIRYSENARYKYGYIVLGDNTPYDQELLSKKIDFYYLLPKQYLIKNIKDSFFLFKHLKKEYDTIYFNTSAIGYIVPYVWAIFFRYKIVIHSHSDGTKTANWVKKIVHSFHSKILSIFIKKRFACSENAAKWMFGRKYKNTIIVPNAIDIERFRYNKEKGKELREKNHFGDAIVLGNVSRLNKIKNHSFLLKLVREFCKRNVDIRLLLVGDGEERETLENLSKKLQIEKYVNFWGQTNRPEDIMNAMDVIVMPSFTEGFPVTLVEAQAAGLPCVVSDSISEEVNITGNVKFLSLNQSYDEWIDIIMSISKVRYDAKEKLINKGYDVRYFEKEIWVQIKEC